jgi:hypothetical protein
MKSYQDFHLKRKADVSFCESCGGMLVSTSVSVKCRCGNLVKHNPVEHDGTENIKVSICRSNRCGRYNSETDTCGILTDRGLRGSIKWLYSHPEESCPHDPPFFTKHEKDNNSN